MCSVIFTSLDLWVYLQYEAEVGGRSVFLFVVVGGVDVDFFKMDEAGQITGRLPGREREKKKAINHTDR